MKGDSLYINAEDGRYNDEGYPIKLSDDIRERILKEIIKGWEAIDEDNPDNASIIRGIKLKTIDELSLE